MAEAAAPEGERASAAAASIRIDVGLLHKLISLIGELVLARRLLQFNAQLEDAALNATEQCPHLMDNGMNTRMQPVGQFSNQLPRLEVEAPNDRQRLLEARLGPLVRELGMQSLDDLYV